SRVAIINAHADPLLNNISEQSASLNLLQHFKPEYDELIRLGLTCSQQLETDSELILLIPSKNKQQTLGWMSEAMLNLADGGKLLVACANNHGAKSYESALKKLAGSVSSSSKSKCRIFSARKIESLDHELAREWITDAQPGEIDSHGLITQPGLFSWDRADIGSELLLKHLPDSLSGIGMDLCCGYGLLSKNILMNHSDIQSLYLIEADRLALNCAEENTKAWHEKVKPHWLDATAGALPLKLDWIVCNPPFHRGQDQDVSIGQTIIANACSSLKRGGKLYMVANRKLPYEKVLDQRLMRHKALVQAEGFKVIEATKGKDR
ncbi:MAG: methyltransferase, partial [Mariprofundaceae bacterium]